MTSIAMVSTRFAPFPGGIETHVKEVAPRLADLGTKVTVLTTDPTGELAPLEEFDGWSVRRFRCWPQVRDYSLSPGLLRELKVGGYELVHLQGIHTLLMPTTLAWAQRCGLPTVMSFHTGGHSSPLRAHLRELQWRVERPVLTRADRLLAVCEYEVELFSRLLRIDRGRFELVRNGSEPLPHSDAVVPSGSPLILSIGRLERYKGHHKAISAMRELREFAPTAHLMIVGSGPYKPQLERLVEEMSLDGVVSFISFAPDERAELGSLIRASDLVVLFSEYEAHPVSVMEALGLGVDVLANDNSGLSELGRQGLIRLAPTNADAATLSQLMRECLEYPRWKAEPPVLPTWNDCAENLATIYREVLA